MARDQSATLSQGFRLSCRPWPCGGLDWSQLPTHYYEDAGLADADLASDPDGYNGKVGFRDTVHAVFSTAGNPLADNAGPIDVLAAHVAADFYQWRSIQYDRVYNGIVNKAPTALDDSVEWSYLEGECTTRAKTAPLEGAHPVSFNHADPDNDCSNCVYVYGNPTDALPITTLHRYKLCLEDGDMKLTPDGVDTINACCQQCETYCVKVESVTGSSSSPTVVGGLAGIAVQAIGEMVSHGVSTPINLAGVTGDDGTWCATVEPGTKLVTARAYTKDGACFASSFFTPDASTPGTCRATFEHCTQIVQIRPYDGDTGTTLAGATLAGQSEACYSTSGGVPTWTVYSIWPAGNPRAACVNCGAPTYATPTLAGYWGGCRYDIALPPCGGTSSYDVVMWSKERWVKNPTIQCSNDRRMVLPKTLCVTVIGPVESMGANSGVPTIVTWDPTSWDGDWLNTGANDGPRTDFQMRWLQCGDAGGASGHCGFAPVDFGSGEFSATLQPTTFHAYMGTYTISAGYGAFWNAGCPARDPVPTCDGGEVTASPKGNCFADFPMTLGDDWPFVSVPIAYSGTSWGNDCTGFSAGVTTLGESCGDTYGDGTGTRDLDAGDAPVSIPAPPVLTPTVRLIGADPTPAAGRIRVGLWAPSLVLGGAERWMATLAKAVDPARVSWRGLAITGAGLPDPAMLGAMGAWMPVASGSAAARDLAADCDVIVSWAVVDVAATLAGLPRPPAVVQVSHLPAEAPWGPATAGLLAGVARHVAVSGSALGPIPPSLRPAATVIRNAVDPDRLVPRRSRAEVRARWGIPDGASVKVALYLGRLAAEKDPMAMARLAAALPPEWWVVVVGEGSLRAELARARAEGGLGRLVLAGPDAAAGDLLAAADCLVSPSRYESFGLSIAEAWWMGAPVVATAAGLAAQHADFVRSIPIGADGPTLAAAVVADEADRIGTSTRASQAQAFARSELGPDRFGRDWTAYLAETLALRNAPRPPTVAEVQAIQAKVKACPFRIAPSCGCSHVPARCLAGKGKEGVVYRTDCHACVKDGGPPPLAPIA